LLTVVSLLELSELLVLEAWEAEEEAMEAELATTRLLLQSVEENGTPPGIM
jgi:hypothetical protein